jgi:hypothetical protein
MRNGDVTVTPVPKDAAVPTTLARRTADETRHLKEEHQLTPIVAWVRDKCHASGPEAPQRSGAAIRMARSRAKKAAAGLVPFDVPAAIVEEVKAAGGWEAWIQAAGNTASRQLEASPIADFGCVCGELGRRVVQATGWRGKLMRWLVKLIASQLDLRPALELHDAHSNGDEGGDPLHSAAQGGWGAAPSGNTRAGAPEALERRMTIEETFRASGS